LAGNRLGVEVAPGLFEAELHFLHRFEWARNADDVLWRRTKLGLHMNADQRDAVARWCASHWQDAQASPAVRQAPSRLGSGREEPACS
jgi:glycerol-3-phosphate dehydrogenase